MIYKKINLNGVYIIEPLIHFDKRGYFYERFKLKEFKKKIGRNNLNFIQENFSYSKKNVLRGLHLQRKYAQGKLVSVIKGKIFDVIVDLRKNSKTYGKWHAEVLTEKNKKMLWIPEGFAHGFLTISDSAEIIYKVNNDYKQKDEYTLLWNDPEINIPWPKKNKLKLSEKDAKGLTLKEIKKIIF